jgi:hypothetical protein
VEASDQVSGDMIWKLFKSAQEQDYLSRLKNRTSVKIKHGVKIVRGQETK